MNLAPWCQLCKRPVTRLWADSNAFAETGLCAGCLDDAIEGVLDAEERERMDREDEEEANCTGEV